MEPIYTPNYDIDPDILLALMEGGRRRKSSDSDVYDFITNFIASKRPAVEIRKSANKNISMAGIRGQYNRVIKAKGFDKQVEFAELGGKPYLRKIKFD